MKKILSMLLVLTLVFTLFAGCGKTEDSGVDTSGQSNEKKDTKEEAGSSDNKEEVKPEETVDPFMASDEPLELTIFEFLKKPFNDEYPIYLKAAEMTNISLTGVVSQSASNNKEAFNLMIASGEVADIVAWDKVSLQQFGMEGAFIPLEELINEHAPNIKAFMDEHSNIKTHATAADGNIYHIPFIPDGDAAEGWFIRQDWLDTLGLEQPKNVEELYTVLKAFREQDPNGNGEKDEIPFFSRTANNPGRVLADFAQLWGAHDADGWYIDGSTVKYGPIEPEFAVAYENLAQWYSEELIDPEIYTRGKTARDFALKENVGGMSHDWFGSTSGYNDKVEIEGFKYLPFAPPADVNGNAYERTVRSKLHWGGWGIAVTNPDPVATIKYFDFWFTEEGRRLANFGIEGETYTMVDGEPIFTDKILNDEVSAVLALREYGAQMATGFQQDFAYEKQWMNPIAFEGVQLYADNGFFTEPFPQLPYTPEEQERIAELMVAIKTLVDESRQKWVLGAEEVGSNFDNYVASIKEYGIDEAIAIQQAAYDRYIGK